MTKEEWETGVANTDDSLRIANIFLTVDGETNAWHQGSWSVFVRLQGCRVGCAWCDTKHTWSIKHGNLMRPEEIEKRVLQLAEGCRRVTITGGEPTEQQGSALNRLLCKLLSKDFAISMETAGTSDLRPLIVSYPELNYIADYKLPSARARFAPHIESLAMLRSTDVLKFVASYDELPAVLEAAQSLRLRGSRARFVVSPVNDRWTNSHALQTFVERCRQLHFASQGIGLNLQMHKFIWADNVRDEESTHN